MYQCSLKPDYEDAQKRMNAFWAHEQSDRPLSIIMFGKQNPEPFKNSSKSYATNAERWLDIEFRVEQCVYQMENTEFYAEAIPVAWPNLGPEIFSAWCGCEYNFGETTAWSKPCINDWKEDMAKAVISWEHPLFKKLEQFTKMLLERGRDKFIVGLTDLHIAGDHLAALRDPANLATDLIDYPDEVKAVLKSSYEDYYKVFDYFTKMIKAYGMPISTWMPLCSEETMYAPNNDFSCMISKNMFDEFFLDGIREECRYYKNSIYHLDGINALRHLDSLLEIPELNAIQWEPGEGHIGVHLWMDVYKKILAAGKSLLIMWVRPDELPILMENLPSKGLMLWMSDINDPDTAKQVIKTLKKWPNNKL